MRALGLDVGERRIGLAVGDTETALAVPVGAVDRQGTPDDLRQVLEHAASREADILVVGMPWSLNGHAGPQAKLVGAFVQALQEATPLPVVTWDERFTSVEADRLLRQGADTGRRRSKGARLPKGVQDAVASAVMLQSYLDAQRSQESA